MRNKQISDIHPKMQDGYQGVKDNFTNRSSCVFPISLSKKNDVKLVFLNYWKIKNNLSSISCNIRIYDEAGTLVTISNFKILKDHNDISIGAILRNKYEFNKFNGVAIIEFISEENFGFTFPGVTAFYTSGDNFSAVHAAGRIKNVEEKKFPGSVKETNWNCKWQEGITPFFSIFNGACSVNFSSLEVSIKEPNQSIYAHRNINVEMNEPFANKIFFLDEIFDIDILNVPKNSYVEVLIPYYDSFPRMICGNFFKENNFYEVTHSFENQENNLDYLPEPNYSEFLSKEVPSINPIATNEELDLKLVYFPTNCEGKVKGAWRTGPFNEKLENREEQFDWVCGGESSYLKEINISNSNIVKALDIYEGSIPTRINTNYVYKVHKSNSLYSTDIAAGHVTKYFPPKKRSWGHGIVGGGYKSILFMTSFSHDSNSRCDSSGVLKIYTKDSTFTSNHIIKAESAIQINLNELLENKIDMREINIISWFYEQEKRTKIMTYWLCYTDSGQITGDHAF